MLLNRLQYNWLTLLITHPCSISYCDNYEFDVIRRVIREGMYDHKEAAVLNGIGKFYKDNKHQYGEVGKY